MKNLERLSLAEMEEFVRGNRKVTLSLEGQAAIYGFVSHALRTEIIAGSPPQTMAEGKAASNPLLMEGEG